MKKLRDCIYLIEGPGQLDQAIQDYCDQCHMDFKDEYITYGNVPTSWPYIAIMNNDETVQVVPEYVKVTDFEKSADDDKNHLFEFNIRRVYLTSPYRVRESLYQIPAKDIFKALITLGQTHSRDEEYDLEVISWTMVR